jgi:ribonucleotide monophosphatase NagD (HAD superfamily)
VRLDEARGFVFDIDGTLAHREGATLHLQPGAIDVLARIRESGRPFVLFTNGSHLPPQEFADEIRQAGLDVSDDELLTPLDSVLFYLRTHEHDGSVLAFVNDTVEAYLEQAGVRLAGSDDDIDAVFVAHQDVVEFAKLERAARALLHGAPLLTGSYAPYYAGLNGPIFSRGAMVTAALAKVSGTEPIVVGKPSRAALDAVRDRLGVPTEQIVVIGDDVTMDIALGRMCGARTILVACGTSGEVERETLPDEHRPDTVIDGVATLLDWL